MKDFAFFDKEVISILSSVDGISDVKEKASRTIEESVWQSKGSFNYNDLKMTYGITRSDLINFYYFNFGFIFKLKKEVTRAKILELVNKFNDTRPAIKASLEEKKGKSVKILFSYEVATKKDSRVIEVIADGIPVIAASPSIFFIDGSTNGVEFIQSSDAGEQ